jgi:hypothetical protein
MKELELPSTVGLSEAVEIQKIIDGQESTDDIKFDEVLKRLPTTEEGAVATMHYIFWNRFSSFDLACLVMLVTEVISVSRGDQTFADHDVAKTLCIFTEEHLTEAEKRIDQSPENLVTRWFITQFRRFLREKNYGGNLNDSNSG